MKPPSSVPVPARPDALRTLNCRDVEVLRCLADGSSTAQIAERLAVSSNTARTKIRRVQGKLDVTGRDAAVRTAQELGVFRIPRPRCEVG